MTSGNMARRKTISIILGATVLGTALLAGCSDSKPAGAPPMGPMPVTVLDVQPQKIPSSVEVMAQTEGARETEVRARVAGILVKRLYQEGETVKAGQPLFQIDRSSYEIALAEAKAKADQTSREMNRLKGLIDAKAISQKEYDDAASANAIAQAALHQAQLNLSWTTVTAPVSGTTGRAAKSEGNLITAGADSLLTSIYQSNPIWVRFSLGDSDLAKLPGGRATKQHHRGGADLADGTVYPKAGKLNFLASNIDTTWAPRPCAPSSTTTTISCCPGNLSVSACSPANAMAFSWCRNRPSFSPSKAQSSCWPVTVTRWHLARCRSANGAARTGSSSVVLRLATR
jgi:membrane fusion protein (multidrug efflux system)